MQSIYVNESAILICVTIKYVRIYELFDYICVKSHVK